MALPPQTKEWIGVMGTFLVTAFALSTLSKAVFGIAWLSSLPIFALFLAVILSAAWGAAYLAWRFAKRTRD